MTGSDEAAGRTILHVDMDAFYVSVEVRRRPELVGKPVVVGGSGDRGVVAAASYEARRYGVFSAMSSVRARRLCPQAIFLDGDHELYAQVSRQVREILDSFTPMVEPIALDEAFLDVTGSLRLFGNGVETGQVIRRRVRDELALSCSVGVAPTKFVAKLASEAAKPRATAAGVRPGAGVVEVTADGVLAFLRPLPVQSLWGVGPKTLERLRRVGIATVGDLADLGLGSVVRAVGKANGSHLHQLASGIDPRPVVSDRSAKSIGHEETFANDRHSQAELRTDLVRMADSVASRLRSHHVAARTVQIKVRFADFSTITRASTLPVAVDDTTSLLTAAADLLAAIDLTPGVRLVGISGSGLVADARQLSFDLDSPGSASAPSGATEAVDAIRERFGANAIGPAALVRPDGGLQLARPGAQQWGPGHSSATDDMPTER